MDIAYTPKDAAIDTVAVILILLPEPATTALGIALLARPRGGKKKQLATVSRRYPNYVYRVDNIRGREITWEARVIMPGQLPLQQPNRPAIKIKQRDELIQGRTANAQQRNQSTPIKLPPGVKVHHTLIKPPREIRTKPNIIPGETIHHELRQFPQTASAADRTSNPTHIHHTIENSPGYIQAQARPQQQIGSNIIHHTLKDAPGAHMNNPIKIEKPIIINRHHTLNPNPSIQEPLIPPATSKPKKPRNPGLIRRDTEPNAGNSLLVFISLSLSLAFSRCLDLYPVLYLAADMV